MNITLGNTIGAGFLGSVVAAVLFGITLVQVYLYYIHYPKDWAFQKVIVAILLALDTVHTALTTYTVYYYVIEQFGNLFALQLIVWSLKVQVLFDVLILLTVQSLYVLRIWKLGGHFSRIWPSFIIVVQAGAYVLGILLVYHTYHLASWADIPTMASVIKATFSYSTGIDIVLAASMCYYLNKSKSTAPFSTTNNRIVAIMQYILISGALTSATSFTILICYVTMPNNLIFIAITFIVTKVYINSYLAMLNARSSVREGSSSYNMGGRVSVRTGGETHQLGPSFTDPHDERGQTDSFQLSSIGTHTGNYPDTSSNQSKPALIGIQIHRIEEKRVDEATDYPSPT